MANRLLARISRLFSFALERDWISANPAFRIPKPGEERSRDRVLSRDELRELWTALHTTEAKNPDGTPKRQLSQTLKDSLIVMLLTALPRCKPRTRPSRAPDTASRPRRGTTRSRSRRRTRALHRPGAGVPASFLVFLHAIHRCGEMR